MAKDWVAAQRKGWLCQLYGQDNRDGSRSLHPDTVQSRQLDILDELVSLQASPKDAASRTAALVLSQARVDTIWLNITGLVIGAAETIDDEKVAIALIDFLVELASLPDAINPEPEAMNMDDGGFTFWKVEPGQPIAMLGGTLWRDLPQYTWGVTETIQGMQTGDVYASEPA